MNTKTLDARIYVFRAAWRAWQRETATDASPSDGEVVLVTVHDWRDYYAPGCIPQPCRAWLANNPPPQIDVDFGEMVRPLTSSGWDMPIEPANYYIPRYEVRTWSVPSWVLQGAKTRRDKIGAFRGMDDAQLAWWYINSSDEYAKALRLLDGVQGKFSASLRKQWAKTGDLTPRQIAAVLTRKRRGR